MVRGAGPTVSVIGHAIILLWGLLSFAPAPLESDISEAIPVEFVTIADVTDLTKGVKSAKKVLDSEETVEAPAKVTQAPSEKPGPAEKPVDVPDPKPVPVPEVAKKAVEPTPPKQAPKPEPKKPEPEPEAAPKPAPVPEPPKPVETPKPAPQKPEPPKPAPQKPEPAKPVPAKPEPSVPAPVLPQSDPLADLIEKAPAKTETAKPEKPVEPAVAEPAPPAPPVQAQATPAPKVSPRPRSQSAAPAPELLDKRKPATNTGGAAKKEASVGTATGSKGAKLTQTELDGLRDAIQRCWALPPGYSAGRDFKALVKARLLPDGRVDGRVNVVNVTGFNGGPPTLVKNAVKVAIEKCQPYKLPANKYADWQNLEVTFYP